MEAAHCQFVLTRQNHTCEPTDRFHSPPQFSAMAPPAYRILALANHPRPDHPHCSDMWPHNDVVHFHAPCVPLVFTTSCKSCFSSLRHHARHLNASLPRDRPLGTSTQDLSPSTSVPPYPPLPLLTLALLLFSIPLSHSHSFALFNHSTITLSLSLSPFFFSLSLSLSLRRLISSHLISSHLISSHLIAHAHGTAISSRFTRTSASPFSTPFLLSHTDIILPHTPLPASPHYTNKHA